MTPLVLEGATLGKRHQHYNSLLKTAVSSDKVQPAKIDYEKTDVENLFNIDIASHNKDVEYILDVLKGDDLLYVSRAIKRSNWLINDDQFAHIIEPQYLHSELFPQMMPKASCKFLLHIRLTLKKESRVEKFFQYFRQKNLKTALKWLPKCPLSVIEEVLQKHTKEISPDLLKRLCERSTTIFDILAKSDDSYSSKELKAAMIILRSTPEKYLDTLNSLFRYFSPNFGKKETKMIMKKCPHRFIDDFEKYWNNIDLDTFAKYLKKDDIESFVLKQLEDKKMKFYFSHEILQIFIKYMPKERKYEFTKQFIERPTATKDNKSSTGLISDIPKSLSRSSVDGVSSSSIYCWYKNVPFEVAFIDLKKIIRTESNPNERNAMLMILVITARKNLDNILSLLQYYRERHMNEPFRFKVLFVNDLLQKTDPHLYDDKLWTLLEEIFHSMEVYIESNNDVQTCLKTIIVRKVLRGEAVPNIVEHKFNFDSLKPFQKKLNEKQKAKVFKYLYNDFFNKLIKLDISKNAQFAKFLELLQQGLILLKDWKKNLLDFPDLIYKIKECAQIKKEKRWATSLTPLYDADKSWRKYLFEYSFILAPSQNVCMNALKHDPELLTRHKVELESIRFNDAISMTQVLRKLRIYWTHGIATEWVSAYQKRLNKSSGHKAVIRGLCSLLNQQQLIDFLKKHEPRETKINWAGANEIELSLCKTIAKNMHIARPQIKPEAVLAYAKGDYVQFTQPSLSAMSYNIKSNRSREYVPELLNGMASLQKHGIRVAFTKLPTADMKQILLDVWKSNVNPLDRAKIFENTHELLCREQDETLVAEVWELMENFIDSLTVDENKAILNTLNRLDKVHPSIKPAYCVKTYRFLKTLPPKRHCGNVMESVMKEINNVIKQLDLDFIADVILDFMDRVLSKTEYRSLLWREINILTTFLLSAADEFTLLQRYEKVLLPLMEKSIASWDGVDKVCRYAKSNIKGILDQMYRYTTDFAFKHNKAKPITLYKAILEKFEISLPVNRNYHFLRWMKLTIAFLDKLWTNNSGSDAAQNWTSGAEVEKQYLAITSEFGELVAQYLKEDVDSFGIYVYGIFSKALEDTFNLFNVSKSVKIKYFKSWLGDEQFVAMYILVNKMIASYYNEDDPKEIYEIHDMLMAHPNVSVEISYYNKFSENITAYYK